MEMEPTPQMIAKKLWNIVKIVLFMIRKGISKSNLMVSLDMMLKRSKIAGKGLGNLMLHHHYAVTCRSDDVLRSFVSPREYEFSCSNSPVYPSYYSRRHRRHGRYYHGHHRDAAVEEVLEMVNKQMPEASPMVAIPGFGWSPVVRQLRVTDSPFSLKGADDVKDTKVDKAAEEFITKFYRELKHQKMAALEYPSPCYTRASRYS